MLIYSPVASSAAFLPPSQQRVVVLFEDFPKLILWVIMAPRRTVRILHVKDKCLGRTV